MKKKKPEASRMKHVIKVEVVDATLEEAMECYDAVNSLVRQKFNRISPVVFITSKAKSAPTPTAPPEA